MIVGIGMDVVEIDRFALAMDRHDQRLRHRFFTREEQDYCSIYPNPVAHYAARFAAKEAFAKALGSGIADGIQWIDVEVVRDSKGQPGLRLHRRALEIFQQRGCRRAWLTMTHTRNVAAATVVLEGD